MEKTRRYKLEEGDGRLEKGTMEAFRQGKALGSFGGGWVECERVAIVPVRQRCCELLTSRSIVDD